MRLSRPQYGLEEEFDPAAALGSTEKVEAALQAAGYHDIQVGIACSAALCRAVHDLQFCCICMHVGSSPGQDKHEAALAMGALLSNYSEHVKCGSSSVPTLPIDSGNSST